MASTTHTLVLLRHGESSWNKENRFTGWTDVDLTDKGRDEARVAGQLMKNEGLGFNRTFTSVLTRAIRTWSRGGARPTRSGSTAWRSASATLSSTAESAAPVRCRRV